MFKKIFFFLIFVGILLTVGAGATLYWFVVEEPGDEITLENIRSILGKESNVYYSDGVTRLGVFFDETHRQYIYYDEIPKDFINALVASEDSSFFKHFGFDPAGIVRAMIANVKANRIVQGGSTLTQQTAKNLFKRKDRSIEAKLNELLMALRLEYHYSKEQILEFYANQFYVSGNGHGLGVAARYFFDKDVADLSLGECAFIAGSVKRPNYYNPFIKKNPEAIQRARQRANVRQLYVLNNMKRLGMLSDYEYERAIEEGVVFKKGQFGYELDYAMDLVRDAVALPVITETLEEKGIDNISTSGASIVTTIDRDLQKETLFSLRKQLSDLDVKLRGYEHDLVQEELAALDYHGDIELAKGNFLFGRVASINGSGATLNIVVDFGIKIGQGIVDAKGVETLLPSWVQSKRGRWAKVKKKDKTAFLKEIQRGDILWVSVRELSEDGTVLLDLEKYPTVQGGAVVMRHGAIRSVVGGSENRFYNRAVYGKRTMGSAFKPFLYTAALQLGWSSSDSLWNGRDLFVYQRQPYFPRPDHKSPYKDVSMSWAGIKSENVASIWLLYHLTDKLDNDQFYDLASHLGFTPQIIDGKEESYNVYSRRLSKDYGILVNRNVLKNAAYDIAVKNSETDFLFAGLESAYEELKNLDYGYDYYRFLEELEAARELELAEKRKNDESFTRRELDEYKLREKMLGKSFLAAGVLKDDLRIFVEEYEKSLDLFAFSSAIFPQYSNKEKMPNLYRSVSTGRFHFGYDFDSNEDYMLYTSGLIRNMLSDMSREEQRRFWRNVVLGETITSAAYDIILPQISLEYEKLRQKNPFDFDVLRHVKDFRVTVGLHYLMALGREMGIESRLEPVLSFPLGSNVVTLIEAVRMYEAMSTGTAWKYPSEEDGGGEELGIIDRIISEEGEVLYQAQPKSKRVLNKGVTLEIGHILENVVKSGTGYRAHREVHFTSDDPERARELKEFKLPVPLLGKTGTANDYTNAAFLGYLPGLHPRSSNLILENGYAVGVYVGYDDNKQMKNKSIRIAGSSGALPAWINIVNRLLAIDNYGDRIDTVDILFNGLSIDRGNGGQVLVAMDTKNGGLPLEPKTKVSESDGNTPAMLVLGDLSEEGKLVLKRRYSPFWTVE